MAESISELQKKVTKAEKLSWSYTGLQNKKALEWPFTS
jgi:hypothetical protein